MPYSTSTVWGTSLLITATLSVTQRLSFRYNVQYNSNWREGNILEHPIHGDQPLYRNITSLLVEGWFTVRLSPWPHSGPLCYKVTTSAPVSLLCKPLHTRSLPRSLFHHRVSLDNSGTTPALISLPCRPFQFPLWKISMKRKLEFNSTFPKYEYLSRLCNCLEHLTPEHLKGVSQSVCRP